MSIREQVLAILEQNRGRSISGESIAKELSVSRNAVWKAITTLRGDGYQIEAFTNRGYCLAESNDQLSEASIRPYLKGKASECRFEVYQEVNSTNVLGKVRGAEKEAEGLVILAEAQSAGRGRMGRVFYSPASTGIYMSVLLRPKIKMEQALFITTAAAVAVSQAIEQLYPDLEAQIKWVNDIYCRDKKVCGILTEASFDFEGGCLEYAVLGIGINASMPKGGFPDGLNRIADSLCGEGDYQPGSRSRLIAEVLNRFFCFYEALEEKNFLEEYRERSFLRGKEIWYTEGRNRKRALVLEIDSEARLVVQFEDGSMEALTAGEVSIGPCDEQ